MPQPPLRPRDEPDPTVDDPLDELPPLDGGVDEPQDSPKDEELDDRGDDGSTGEHDDETAEEDPVDPADVGVDDPEESGWIDEPADNPDLEVGTEVLDLDASAGTGSDEPDGAPGLDDDLGLGDSAAAEGLDAGEEGPVDPDEELRDEDLPSLDADAEGDLEAEALLDARFAADEPLGLGWAAEPWPRVGAPVPLLGATAIACVGRGALVAVRGDAGYGELQHLDLEGTRSPVQALGLAGDVRVVSVSAGLLAVATAEGQAYGSDDEGAHFAPVAKGLHVVDVVIGPRVLWALTRAGGLWRAPLAGRDAASPFPASGSVGAIAGDPAGGVTAIVIDSARRPLAVLRARADGTTEHEPARGGLEPMGAPRVAARGPCVAYPWAGGVVRRGADGQWRSFRWEGRVTALTFVADDGTLVGATYSDADDTTALVRLDVSGHASLVARIGAVPENVDSDGRAVAVVCDDPRGVVWVAGGFGVAAFALR